MIEQYKKQLENDPHFQYGTIRIYIHAVKTLIDEYGENPSIEQINKFILDSCNKRQAHAKYAVKEYLKLLNREDDYIKLVQAKIRKPIRPKVFLSREKLRQIVYAIKKEPYRTIGLLQMSFASRASGVITIERKRIRKGKDSISINLKEKGDKPIVVYLKLDSWKLIEPYYNVPKQYLFLEEEASTYSREQLQRRVNTIYKRYLEHLQAAAKKAGYEVGTHDIRRSIANIIRIETKDPLIVKTLLGHSSLSVTEKYLEDNSKEMSDVLLRNQDTI